MCPNPTDVALTANINHPTEADLPPAAADFDNNDDEGDDDSYAPSEGSYSSSISESSKQSWTLTPAKKSKKGTPQSRK